MENQRVWLPDTEAGFVRGTITDLTADGVVVQPLESGRSPVSLSYQRLYPAEDSDTDDVDDNCSLMHLNEATLLNNIRLRYERDRIYTYVANILIAVNPYKDVRNLYAAQTIDKYRGKSLGVLPPHVFAIADKAFRDMKVLRQSQSIVVSGESGAGKTESTKHILSYLCSYRTQSAGAIEAKILEANPILEAFGNAKTTRNNNSSRFGKFIEVHFDPGMSVVGGFISHYLLERSRIVGQSRCERNYHIFYQLCAGASPQLRHKLQLASPDHFHYLSGGCTQYFAQSSDVKSDEVVFSRDHKQLGALKDPMLDDARDFISLDKALGTVGLSESDRESVYCTVAAVLHLGNIMFEEDTADSKGGCVVVGKSERALSTAASLMGVDAAELRQALLSRVMQTNKASFKGTIIMVPLKVHEANSARDALAKSIYSRLFDYIVHCINKSIPFTSSSYYIGVLDIAGFEYFTVNSFEQFCINYCNEKLQQFFNQRILKDEQVLYDKEALGVKKISYIDNQDAIELVEGRGGVLCLLDEEAKLPRPSPSHFTQSVHQQWADSFRLALPRKSKLRDHRDLRDDEGFLVRHFAGAVCYHTEKFLEKNNDALHASLEALLQESQSPFLKSLFSSTGSSAGCKSGAIVKINGASKPNNWRKLVLCSVGSKFKEQLHHLMEKLNSTGTNFVRCIKPNAHMVDGKFEGGQILSQLQCSGMTAVLQLMHQGYPSRAPFNQLYAKYAELLPQQLARLDHRLFCKLLFRALGLADHDYRFGLTRVFFRPGKFAEFDQLMHCEPQHLAALVARVHRWLLISRWKKAQWCALSAVKLRNKILYRRASLILLQTHVRGVLARKRYRHRYRATLKIGELQKTLAQIADIVAQMKSDASGAKRLLGELQHKTTELLLQLRTTDISAEQTETELSGLTSLVTSSLQQLQQQLASEREQARLQLLRQQVEREQQLQQQQEQQLQQQQLEERRQRQQLQLSWQQQQQQLELDQSSAHQNRAAALQLQQQLDNEAQKQQSQLEQEQRDYELALRLACESKSGTVEDVLPLKRSSMVNQQRAEAAAKKHDLSKWKYSELRDVINTSCDIELLEACRGEFHRRLKVYHAWKANNRQQRAADPSSSPSALSSSKGGQCSNVPAAALKPDDQRAPNCVLQAAAAAAAAAGREGFPAAAAAATGGGGGGQTSHQRYFRIPFVRPSGGCGSGGGGGGGAVSQQRGWWFAHFSGQWIVRQMELHPHRQPLLLTAGKDSMQMCELSLDETGLTRKRGAEILPAEFDREWNRHITSL